MINNFVKFFILCAWVIGIIGGIISACLVGYWGIAVCVFASIWMGYDKAKAYVEDMMA